MILLSSHSRSVKSVAGNDDSPGGAGKVKFLWSSFANCRSFCLDLYIKILFVLLEKVKKEAKEGIKEDAKTDFPVPLTGNAYEHAQRQRRKHHSI